MKLSEYRGEDALDLLADLLDPMSEILTDEKLKAMLSVKETKVVDIAKFLLKEHKSGIIAVLARLNGEEVYNANAIDILKMVLEFVNDSTVLDFFVSQAQKKGGETSTPATENIKGIAEA